MSWNEVAVACLASFLLTVVFTRLLIPFLKSRQLGKTIREDGPAHQAKAGTPTMGGLGMLAAIGLIALVTAWQWWGHRSEITRNSKFFAWDIYFIGPVVVVGIVALMVGFALLGLTDDFQGLARKGIVKEIGVGISARNMLALQTLLAAAAAFVFMDIGGSAFLAAWNIPWLVQVMVMALVIVGTVNGVNLSDGLDGLATGLLALAFSGLGLVMATLLSGTGQPVPIVLDQTALVDGVKATSIQALILQLSFTAAAACLGFLVFNRHPARVFMGNVASMGLGALLAALAIIGGVWYLLPIIGAVFVVEVVSDIIQIVYFKRTGGKRFFLMAPIHHHFEKLGWPETKVVTVFWSCGLVAGLAGVGLAALLARS